MPLSTIITTANMASRASAGLPPPVNMAEAINMASMPVTDRVSTSVPRGSPSRTAMLSACRTTPKADSRITERSHVRRKVNQAGLDRSSSQALPNARNRAAVPKSSSNGRSRRQICRRPVRTASS